MKELTFEQAMEQLDEIVKALESGEAPLEQSIELYKKGMELSAFCKEKLNQAEKQMVTVIDEVGNEETMNEEQAE